jgi:serine protease inhibitor
MPGARETMTQHRPTPLTAAAMALAAATALGACHADRIPGPDDVLIPGDLTAEQARVSEANTTFGLGLLRVVHRAESEPNLLLSPLSASMSLGMAMNGAAGETFAAMSRTLGFDGLDQDEINEAYRGLIRNLEARDARVEFRLANAVWYKQGFQVNPDFFERARDFFGARVAPLDFLDPASPGVINRWVEEETGGRIRDLIQAIDPLDRMFLVNAVYFKAPWTSPFGEHSTGNRPFTRADGAQVEVPTMVQDGPLRWFRDEDVQAVELLYADSAFSMVVVGPGERGDLGALIGGLTPERWNEWMGRFEASRLMLMMPKFRFDYGVQLAPPLDAMGMGIAFRPREADFSRIAPVDDLHISRVKQKSFIDVHELGTEAAAATATVMSVTSMPPLIHFDRPFLFAIRERSTGTILFIGRVGDPSN